MHSDVLGSVQTITVGVYGRAEHLCANSWCEDLICGNAGQSSTESGKEGAVEWGECCIQHKNLLRLCAQLSLR